MARQSARVLLLGAWPNWQPSHLHFLEYGEQLLWRPPGLVKKFAVPCEPSWGSQLAPPRLMLGGQQVQELAFSWKPMVANLAGFVWWFSQSLLGSNLLDWIVFPRWRCL